jgi:hypothetical protein
MFCEISVCFRMRVHLTDFVARVANERADGIDPSC